MKKKNRHHIRVLLVLSKAGVTFRILARAYTLLVALLATQYNRYCCDYYSYQRCAEPEQHPWEEIPVECSYITDTKKQEDPCKVRNYQGLRDIMDNEEG